MEAKKGAGSKGSGKADWALNHIQKLYRVETQLKEETAATRYTQRQEKSLPLLNQLETWLTKSAQSTYTARAYRLIISFAVLYILVLF